MVPEGPFSAIVQFQLRAPGLKAWNQAADSMGSYLGSATSKLCASE